MLPHEVRINYEFKWQPDGENSFKGRGYKASYTVSLLGGPDSRGRMRNQMWYVFRNGVSLKNKFHTVGEAKKFAENDSDLLTNLTPGTNWPIEPGQPAINQKHG